MQTKEEATSRLDLVQGTLDMLILRTLVLGPAHGHEIAKHIQRTTDDVLQVEHGSLIRRSTASNAEARSARSGRRREAASASSSITGSLPQAKASSSPSTPNGGGSSLRLGV